MGNKILKLQNLVKINNKYLSRKEMKFFKHIVFKNEYGNVSYTNIKKWKGDIFIYLHQYGIPTHLIDFISKSIKSIVNEINEMSSSNKLYIINKESYIEYKKTVPLLEIFGSNQYNVFSKRLSKVGQQIFKKKKDGFFNINYNRNFEIEKGIVYINIFDNQKNRNRVLHLLREEIIQSLGMVNDIDLENSIFNQNFDKNYKYSKMDKKLITFFLSSDIKPGANKKEIKLLNNKKV